jgi:hypothetical protein
MAGVRAERSSPLAKRRGRGWERAAPTLVSLRIATRALD